MKREWLIVVGVLVVAALAYLYLQNGGDDGSTDDGTDESDSDFDDGSLYSTGSGAASSTGDGMNYTGTITQIEETGDGSPKLTAYPDAGGYSIGFGHHGADVTAGETITADQANAYLQQDLATAVAFVNKHVSVPLTQDQFNGLVDFVYNVGVGTAAAGTVFTLVNSGDFGAVAAKLEEYVYSGGRKLASLLPRRIAEAAGFSGGE